MSFAKRLALTLSASWSMGLGLRMIVEYFKHSIYTPNFFDVIFDWGGLTVLGFVTLIIALKSKFK